MPDTAKLKLFILKLKVTLERRLRVLPSKFHIFISPIYNESSYWEDFRK